MEQNKLLKMSDDEYFALEGYASSSVLKVILRLSAKHLLIPYKDSKDKKIGSLSHCHVLENEHLWERYVIEPEFNPTPNEKGVVKEKGAKWKTTNDYKAQLKSFQEDNPSKIIISEDELSLATKWSEAVYSTSMADDIFNNPLGKAEVVILTSINGIPVKVKLDWIIVDHDKKQIIMADYKTSASASERKFSSSIYYGDGKLGDYNLQAALYSKAVANVFPDYDQTWLWCVLEKSDIPQCCWYGMSQKAYDDGWEKVQKSLEDYAPIMIDCYSGYKATEEVVWL
jgi:hypothetical protein